MTRIRQFFHTYDVIAVLVLSVVWQSLLMSAGSGMMPGADDERLSSFLICANGQFERVFVENGESSADHAPHGFVPCPDCIAASHAYATAEPCVSCVIKGFREIDHVETTGHSLTTDGKLNQPNCLDPPTYS